MDNFNWTQFSKRIFINTEIALAYDFWTKSVELEKWFLSKSIFFLKNGKEIPPSENVLPESKYNWNWFAQNHFEEGIVLTANGIDLIEFSFAGECKVQVKLSKENNKVLVELTQTEIPLDNISKENVRLGCAFGWTFYLLNLKSVLEGGLDLRNKNTELTGVVNN